MSSLRAHNLTIRTGLTALTEMWAEPMGRSRTGQSAQISITGDLHPAGQVLSSLRRPALRPAAPSALDRHPRNLNKMRIIATSNAKCDASIADEVVKLFARGARYLNENGGQKPPHRHL